MSLVNARSRLEALLERTWAARRWQLVLACIPLAVISVALQNGLEWGIDTVLDSFGSYGRVDEITAHHAERSWVGPLLFAPVFENLLCLFWVVVFSHGLGRTWWLVPCIVAGIAAAFHVLAYMEPRYASIFVDFFLMCCLVHNAKDRVAGFWASVFLHFLVNLTVLLQWRMFGVG